MRLHFSERVTELGYVLALDARFCGFRPHPTYHLRRVRIAAGTVVLESNQVPLEAVKFESHTLRHFTNEGNYENQQNSLQSSPDHP